LTDQKTPFEPTQNENEDKSSEKPASKWAYHKPQPRDPVTGVTVNKNGSPHASSGAGPLQKTKIIPPVDMAALVEKGISPTLYTNWDPNDPDSNWHLSFRKFTPERKEVYLSVLEQQGVIAIAARWAGVSTQTVLRHRKEDPLFDAACNEAEGYYHAMCGASILSQARVGQIDERYNNDGKLISRRVSYETRIREIMLKRAFPDYNEVSKQEVSVVGGAVVVPAPIDSVESWDDVVRRHTGGGQSPALESGGTIDTDGSEVGKKDT
jgi:hypothetical protein